VSLEKAARCFDLFLFAERKWLDAVEAITIEPDIASIMPLSL